MKTPTRAVVELLTTYQIPIKKIVRPRGDVDPEILLADGRVIQVGDDIVLYDRPTRRGVIGAMVAVCRTIDDLRRFVRPKEFP